ncbi:ABC transporter ATP-binding protein [Nonomuraea fuscirosea]|uniref:ABC transporter ATP-binding protein n=1 Tax=Nonomuraea fuscirosea TaxID=1291556 RepID=UPI00343FDD70
MKPALRTDGLGVRYHRSWALRDCSLSVPAGRVAALVGPNGAGKTTLMQAVAGLLKPTCGSVTAHGEVAFVAQDRPLTERFTVAEMLAFGRRVNARFDDRAARDRLGRLGVPLDRKVGVLSDGQRAQVTIALALARRPDLLVLDEPLANLDPLARHDVMRSIMVEVAEREVTVLLSSHVVADIEETCDWLIMLNDGQVQVSGDIEELLAHHYILTGADGPAGATAAGAEVVSASHAGTSALLVRGEPAPDPRGRTRRAGLADLVMGYLRSFEAAALSGPGPVFRR